MSSGEYPSYEPLRLRPMDLGLRGKVALVAAASQGLGRAAAFAFAREGCKVAICARNARTLEDAAKAIRKETNAEVMAIPADISRADGVKAYVDGAITSFRGGLRRTGRFSYTARGRRRSGVASRRCKRRRCKKFRWAAWARRRRSRT